MTDCAFCDRRDLRFFMHVEGKTICLACAEEAGIHECDHHRSDG